MNSEDVCADCSAPAPTWASINRGVFICDECCSVHRSLGRHVSNVRSLRANNWPPVLREMVSMLVKKGANTVWEHALHDPHSKVKVKKPSPKDKLQPTKHDFIVMKYKHLMLLSKANSKDNPNLVQELSKQLHASVRTANLDTCLRILSLGADPNFLHPERGNTPLHVAAQAGQAMQVELLVVYGANPTTLDKLGHTSEECARIGGHHELADRLIECQYELTDKLSYFLCGRKPSHSTGEHFLLPAGTASNALGLTEARTRLQELNNQLLEELAADVYDEVDRRESDAIWLSTQQNSSAVAFLPVNPKLSSLRNQGRQKLGILDTQEFSQLITDILIDTKRRHKSSLSTVDKSGTVVPSDEQDDLHDYDEVPVENERGETMRRKEHKYDVVQEEQGRGSEDYSEPREDEPSPKASQDTVVSKATPRESLPPPVTPLDPTLRPLPLLPGQDPSGVPDVNTLLERLKKVEAERDSLASANQLLEQRLCEMQKQLNKMIEENAQLRTPVQTPTHEFPPVPIPAVPAPEASSHVYSMVEKPKRIQSTSKSEPKSAGSPTCGNDRERNMPSVSSEGANGAAKTTDHTDEPPFCDSTVEETEKNQQPSEKDEGKRVLNLSDSNSPVITGEDAKTKAFSQSVEGGGTKPAHNPSTDVGTIKPSSQLTESITQEDQKKKLPIYSDWPSNEATDFAGADSGGVTTPTLEEVNSHIKLITQNIQELLTAAQGQKQASFGPNSAKVAKSIAQMTKCFSARCPQVIQASLREVGLASQQLQKVCLDSSQTADITHHTRLIVGCCYEVAKAARHLVMCVQQEQQ